MMLKAQGLNYATIACRLGLSPSQVSKIARDYIHRMYP
jgi:transcriptional regulator with XRE-family HTH domain